MFVNAMIDFYRIDTLSNGVKIIEPEYYYYFTEDEETPGRCVYYHYYMELEEFLAMDKDERTEWLNEAVKYIDDLTENDTYEWYKESLKDYENVLDYNDLNMDTPVGNYHTSGKNSTEVF